MENSNHDMENYETGYSKPPANTRFKKGQSGNPKGRPRGSRGVVSIFTRTLKERLTVNEGGRRKVISKLEGISKQLVNSALSSDPNALRLLMPLLLVDKQATDQYKAAEHVEEADGEMIAAVQEELLEIYKNGGFDR